LDHWPQNSDEDSQAALCRKCCINTHDEPKRAVNRKHNALQGSCGRWDHAFVQRITNKKLTNKGWIKRRKIRQEHSSKEVEK